jgi:hypothetical protein
VPVQQAEFGDERRRQRMAAQIPRIRVLREDLVAEIILDRRKPKIVHCVVHRQGSPEILLLEQFYSREEAEAALDKFISEYCRMRPRPKTSATSE